ncbi:enolase C-terminal domain-like protein [Mesorhizobium sp. M0228]|uniref:enolase C-terminal domain-like protein n=1 Tax=Mesorhizobium sp. M0228 TaxID=2956923 RepID=UPI00333563D3
MPGPSTIVDISVAAIQGQLPAPVIFGDWVMKQREFVVVRLRTQSGHEGWSFTLTRDGACAEQIRKSIAPVYIGTDVGDRVKTFKTAKGRSYGSHSAGVGLRALSQVDLAAWDAAAKIADKSIAEFLGGTTAPMPATAIVGYPPALMNPQQIGDQVKGLYAAGWRRFKAPMGVTLDESEARLRAARRNAPDAWLGTDLVWMFSDVDAAAAYANRLADLNMGCIEDIFPPGNARKLAELRKRVPMPIWQGDEQGGSYYPEALIMAGSVDRVRVDLTCMGGITGGRAIIDECLAAGVDFGPHMFAHVHSPVFSAWGFSDKPVEWGVPWSGVDPYADSLVQPEIIKGGLMKPLPAKPGFGDMLNREWALSQPHQDPDHILN